jgi:hypothetical protein
MFKSLLAAAALAAMAGCGSRALTNAPSIFSFTAAAPTITKGQSTTLLPIYNWGYGTLTIPPDTSAVFVVQKGYPYPVTPAVTTTYTLTVTGDGPTAVETTTVTVVPPPVATSLTAASTTITAGASTTLTAEFTDGNAEILTSSDGTSGNLGQVTAGAPVTVTPSATTTYTLTVINAAGTAVSAPPVTVTVTP